MKNLKKIFDPAILPWLLGSTAVFLLLALYNFYYGPQSDDISLYFNTAHQWFAGLVPFRDFTIEYPPGALLFMAVPHFLGSNPESYKVWYSLLIVFFLTVCTSLLYDKKDKYPLLLFVLCVILCPFEIVFQRLDVLVGILTLISLILVTRKRWIWSALVLGLSITVKFYPLVLVPFILVYLRNWKQALSYGTAVVLVIVAILGSFFLSGAKTEGLFYFWTYNQNRQIHLESTWSSLAMVLDKPVEVYTAYGAKNLASPHDDQMTQAALYVFVTLFFVLFTSALFVKKKGERWLWDTAFLVVLTFIVCNKVFSPQFLLWIIPLFGITSRHLLQERKVLFGLLLNLLIFLTHLVVPIFFLDLIELKPGAVSLLFWRNMLIIGFLMLYFYQFLETAYGQNKKSLHRSTDV